MSGNDGYAEYLVSKEITDYNMEDLFTEAQKNAMYLSVYHNLYRYGMDEEFAVRDAVSEIMLSAEICVPESYKKRLWIA